MTDESIANLVGAITSLTKEVVKGQQALQQEIKSMAEALKAGSLKIDPSKLIASTANAPVNGLSIILPKDPNVPNLQDPLKSYPAEIAKLAQLNAGSGSQR